MTTTEPTVGRGTVVLIAVVALALGVALALLLFVPHGQTITHNHVVHVRPHVQPNVSASTVGQAGAIAAAEAFANSWPTGRRAYGYRVLSFTPRKALIEFISPENISGSVRWWIIDAPTVWKGRWSVVGQWMTLQAAGSPPPPLNDYRPWPS